MAHLEHPDFKAIAAFTVTEPTGASQPFVFNSPHSGNIYPKRFVGLSKLDAITIRRSEDLFVDELFSDIPQIGAPLLAAKFPRAYLDLNREPYELDPKMYTGPLPAYANVRSIRVAGGLGTVARVVAESQEIYADKIEVEDALTRVEMLYKPYHAMLRKLLAETHARHGRAYLIDCHSMPSGGDERGTRPDFVLGDRYGTSCPSALTEIIADLLSERGYLVNRNKPYAGGFITEHYGRPSTGLHALQLEINRGLYADEDRFERNEFFDTVKTDLCDVFKEVFDLFGASEGMPLAAE